MYLIFKESEWWTQDIKFWELLYITKFILNQSLNFALAKLAVGGGAVRVCSLHDIEDKVRLLKMDMAEIPKEMPHLL